VILFGFTAGGYTFGALLQLVLAGELEKILGRMTKEIDSLHGHTIVVGYGRIGRILAGDLVNPRADEKFAEGDVVIVLGKADDIARFRRDQRL
jgi:Trk K+ transport system NAD-binding subunit